MTGAKSSALGVRFKTLLTSLSLIVLVALGTRVGYAWEQQSTTPHWALASVPFLYEPGNIAHSLAVRKGICFAVSSGYRANRLGSTGFIR